jgi:hypothetical protein
VRVAAAVEHPAEPLPELARVTTGRV